MARQRNVYDAWSEYNEKNRATLLDHVTKHAARRRVPWKRFGDECGFAEIDRWIRQEEEDYRKISATHYYRVVLAGLRDGWLGMDERPLYEQFRAFLGDPALEQVAAQAEHFEVFRYSYLARQREYVLRGGLTITYSSNAITTKESYKIQKEVMAELGLGANERDFPRAGMLFPRDEKSYLMISKRINEPKEIQTALVERLSDVLQGAFSDLHGRHFHATLGLSASTVHRMASAFER